MRGLALVLGVALIGGAAGARDLLQPAELPPASYAGQQYVDSKGCLFMRAGKPGQELWLPRVTRQGVPVCDNPPSGNRVPVVEEGASTAAEPVPTARTEVPAAEAAAGGYYVAVGSFGVAANADKAVARLQSLSYPFARGRMPNGSATLVTVFAGPFDSAATAAKARAELRGAGFPDAVVIGP